MIDKELYGLVYALRSNGETLVEIGRVMKISASRVGQMEAIAENRIHRLADALFAPRPDWAAVAARESSRQHYREKYGRAPTRKCEEWLVPCSDWAIPGSDFCQTHHAPRQLPSTPWWQRDRTS